MAAVELQPLGNRQLRIGQVRHYSGGMVIRARLWGRRGGPLLLALVAALRAGAESSAARFPEDALDALREKIEGARAQQIELERRIESLRSADTGGEAHPFWSFQPLRRVEPPVVADLAWSANPIDRFIRDAQEKAGLSASPCADRRTLIRRAYFDLVGLPPSPEEIEAFVQDESEDAYERVIDTLLASPHFGERWGRHWLDVARYADSDGYEFDMERPTAYHYRDFVIRAFNDDMPFDRFVRWQLAGDEYEPGNPLANAATGFLAAGPTISNQQNEQNRYDELDDMISTTSLAMLGLTVGCARCHDHKYDPISQRDYYRMLSAFTTTKRHEALMVSAEEAAAYRARLAEWEGRMNGAKSAFDAFAKPFRVRARDEKIDGLSLTDEEKDLLRAEIDEANDAQKKLVEKFRDAIKADDARIRAELGPEDGARWDELAAAIAEIEKTKPASPPTAYAMTDASPEAAESYHLVRGNPEAKKETVTLAFLSPLPGADSPVFAPDQWRDERSATTQQRRALAEWLTDVERGAGRLTARVIANRLWHHHFGRGIVRTPNDFGTQGDRPSHPELLDWLATELIANGWRLKPIHRLIVTSETYRQASIYDEKRAAADPANRLLWRREPRRLEAEVVRDAMLSVSACLNPRMYGPGVFPYVPVEAIATGSTEKWPRDVKDGPDTWRRSVYVYTRRSARVPMMESFDTPDTTASCGARLTTTTAPQALALMNNRFVSDQARYFAERVRREGGEGPSGWVRRAYELALGRSPREGEWAASVDFIEKQSRRHEAQEIAETKDNMYALRDKDPVQAALADFCQVVLSLNEFVYID